VRVPSGAAAKSFVALGTFISERMATLEADDVKVMLGIDGIRVTMPQAVRP
jgi:hypothetical protein